MNGSLRRSALSLTSSILLFLLLFFALQWNILVAAGLSVGTYFGVYNLTKPKLKIGNTELERLANGEEIKALYDQSLARLDLMKKCVRSIEVQDIAKEAHEITSTTTDIMSYLKDNPRDISKSRHFLEYYLKTTAKILSNYVDLKRANVSGETFQDIQKNTLASLKLLNDVFIRQRDSYHADKILDLELESELLEKTLKLGGDK